MNAEILAERLKQIAVEHLPFPGSGKTAERHSRLMQIGREDLSLAKLAEAHWDAVSILAESGRNSAPGALYAVWASEIPGKALHLEKTASGFQINGSKVFCSGTGIVDRALVTVGSQESRLVEIDLRNNSKNIETDPSAWASNAFRLTQTGAVTFRGLSVTEKDFVGDSNWYLNRPGFWHGACGPAACWVGGAAALVDFAMQASRDDTHTLAHLGAMDANSWMMEGCLDVAGRQIDQEPLDYMAAQIRALRLRHLVEAACTDTLRRFARAYGPQPLVMNHDISRRYHEVELYVRQSHAERDLESLARLLRPANPR
jgi:alkylation response protein AidB-like acyl-CoA dehydrogenase